jgi:hypothetical protein
MTAGLQADTGDILASSIYRVVNLSDWDSDDFSSNSSSSLGGAYRKISELGKEADFLKGLLDKHSRSQYEHQREEREREELFSRRNEVWCEARNHPCTSQQDEV